MKKTRQSSIYTEEITLEKIPLLVAITGQPFDKLLKVLVDAKAKGVKAIMLMSIPPLDDYHLCDGTISCGCDEM